MHGPTHTIMNGDTDMRALDGEGVPAIDLSGRVAIVTGAAQGQGAAEARHFCDLGATVIMADISDEKGEAVASKIGATYRHTDVSRAADWEELMAAVMAAHGRLDILVNNAAVHWMRLIEDEKIEEFDRLIGVNLRGTFLGIKSAIAPMRASGGGSIVNIASIAGVRGFQQHGSYGASKWAIRGLTKTAAAELGPSRIRVNAVVPGTIDSPMAWGGGEMPAGVSFDHLPLGRVGEVEDIAAMVAFLASDAASYITGAEVVIDGGATLGMARRDGQRI
jgi:3alpha(or 20beta)-hydroxysteroid dehydrogenase